MAKPRARVLVVDDELIKRCILEDGLRAAGYDVATAANPLEAASSLDHGAFDVVLTDLRMPGQDGLSFLRDMKRRRPEQAVIIMTAYGSVESAVEAMKLGAFDYIQKPFSTEELLLKLERLLHYQRLAEENETLREQLARRREETRLVGRSAAMEAVFARLRAAARADATVLLEGESGTGKELAARAIHEASVRASGPLMAVSCAALPRDLIEAELFGHEPGAFTGAAGRRFGRIESAHGGTLFLDDVDDIPLEVQVKLVRVLEERKVERIGGAQAIPVNLRVIAATKRSLAALVEAGRFREDLYYRLNVVLIRLPPLRERLDDIPILAEHFLEELALRLNRQRLALSAQAISRLQSYHWPGNVRQLRHVLERMAVVNDKTFFDAEDLAELSDASGERRLVSLMLKGREQVSLLALLADVEARVIQWALDKSGGNVARAADILRIPRSTLQYRLARVGERPADDPSPLM